jgi:hypothetical protein
MANPNIVNVTTINGQTAAAALTTSQQIIVQNASASGKIYKINTILVANKDGSSAADVTVNFNDGATSTNFAIASTISVPADASIVIIDKNSSFYLTENTSVEAFASASGDLDIIVSYEEIS